MDSLKDLKVDESENLNQNQKELMHKYFGQSILNSTNNNSTNKEVNWYSDPKKWKLIAILSAVFIVLSNPITKKFFNKISYIEDNKTLNFGFTVILFFVIVTIVILFF